MAKIVKYLISISYIGHMFKYTIYLFEKEMEGGRRRRGREKLNQGSISQP